MERRLNRGWGPVFAGCGGTGGSCPSQSAIGPWDWGFHTVRGAVWARESSIFVPGMSEL